MKECINANLYLCSTPIKNKPWHPEAGFSISFLHLISYLLNFAVLLNMGLVHIPSYHYHEYPAARINYQKSAIYRQ